MKSTFLLAAGVALIAGFLDAPSADQGQEKCSTGNCPPPQQAICPCFSYEEAARMIARMGEAPHKGSYYDPPPYEVWLIAAYQLSDGDGWLYSVMGDEDGTNWCSYFDDSAGIDRPRQVASAEQIAACAQLIEQVVVDRSGLGPQMLANLMKKSE